MKATKKGWWKLYDCKDCRLHLVVLMLKFRDLNWSDLFMAFHLHVTIADCFKKCEVDDTAWRNVVHFVNYFSASHSFSCMFWHWVEISKTFRSLYDPNVVIMSLKYSVNPSHLGENVILLWPLGFGFKRLSVVFKEALWRYAAFCNQLQKVNPVCIHNGLLKCFPSLSTIPPRFENNERETL